ncbi:MAG: type 4a pilus biogenesis protein PilO [Desulfobulbaceae bacterium]|uniref:Type 4a pilus biogenesis protein PilO n=1 Tax=Candidatus Desulfatifera sulfidica TaxID=2841691 RepID=A0A8J6N8Y7_9BACT|nr:type 4a pilus biogenesis protein PilO [Candidatus Desulfatifera sulfidica]
MIQTNKIIVAWDTFINDTYLPLQQNVKIALAVAILLVPAVLFFFLSFQPSNKKIQALTNQKTQLNQELQLTIAKAKNLEKLQAEMAATEELFLETGKLLPKKKEIPALLTNISSLGRSAGLDFLTFKPLSDIDKDFYAEIPVDIHVQGPYHNVGLFLDQVNKLDRIVTVSNINLGGPKKDENEMILSSTCRLVTYRFTNKQLAPKAEGQKKK